MTRWQIMDYAEKCHVKKMRLFGRTFLWIPYENFEAIKGYFTSELNVFQRNGSYRSQHVFRHIHAADQGDVVFLHIDHGNPTRFFPLILIHGILDVIPFFTYCLLTWTKPRRLWS